MTQGYGTAEIYTQSALKSVDEALYQLQSIENIHNDEGHNDYGISENRNESILQLVKARYLIAERLLKHINDKRRIQADEEDDKDGDEKHD